MGSDPYIGEITLFAGNYAPMGWALCDGRLLQISQYQALYAVIGTTYGGNGTTNFALPDLRGKSALGMGAGVGLTPRALGSSGGSENVTLTVNQLPAHNHNAQSAITGAVTAQMNCVMEAGTSANPKGAYVASNANAFLRSGTVDAMNSGAVTVNTSSLAVNTSVGNTGSNMPQNTMHPFLTLNYIIALEGIFPPRD